jgi:hypothetical protein
MATTLQDLRNIAYSILREEENTSAYPLVLMDLLLNTAQQSICFGNVVNPLTKEQLKKWQLSFLQTEKIYTTIQTTTLTAAATVWWATLSLDTTNFSTTGQVYIWGNVITYTGKSATQLTWCSNILYAHLAGSEVSFAYAVPADYASIINVTYNNNTKLEWKLYDDVFEDMNSNKHPLYPNSQQYNYTNYTKPFYTIKDNTYIILWNLNDWNKSLRVRYEKTPTTMTTGASTATITNDIFAQTTIPYYAVGEMLFQRGEESRAAEIINFWMGKIKEMYTYYNQASFEKQSGVQYKMSKWRLNI